MTKNKLAAIESYKHPFNRLFTHCILLKYIIFTNNVSLFYYVVSKVTRIQLSKDYLNTKD